MATNSPPMMATAIGPKKALRESGIMARMAAAAVRMIGRKRRTVEPTMACQLGMPAFSSWSIWSIRITELRMIMPDSAIVPSMATKPKGLPKSNKAIVTPMIPSGAVSTTITVREKFCNCSISTVSTTRKNSGTPAATEAPPLALSSTDPPTTTW